jgi:hypothetical protein
LGLIHGAHVGGGRHSDKGEDWDKATHIGGVELKIKILEKLTVESSKLPDPA